LGNSKAHPNHYNFFGKGLDNKLEALGATRIFELGLGDDGDCLEDDYDTWMEQLLQRVYDESSEEAEEADTEEPVQVPTPGTATATAVVEDPTVTMQPCMGAKVKGGSRLISAKYDRLMLKPSGNDFSRDHLLDLTEDTFYMKNTNALPVLSNRPLNSHAGENGMYEMRVSLENAPNVTYETGDHLMVYPQNSEVMVQAYLQQMDVDPHVKIDVPDEETRYPHPKGITLTETLRHCIDLSAVPSPNVARLLTGRKQIDYKNEIATPRRTVLDLLANAPRKFALEEILNNLPPMKPRYYSIASSSMVHPKEIYLVYRPVTYLTTHGHFRTGVSTSYLKNMMGVQDACLDEYNTDAVKNCSHVIASVNSNPHFRLPSDRKTPVLFVAGGCGIAPIRAFLEERIHSRFNSDNHNPFSEGYLFLGFRSPWDTPYKSLVEKAFQCGAISNLHITFNGQCKEGLGGMPKSLQPHTSCGLVSDAVGDHGEQLYSFFERGGHTYICGGARLFGVAIENEVHALLQKYGNLSEDEASNYLRKMTEDER
jgi:NADPH-ferrihemoprotein reductase